MTTNRKTGLTLLIFGVIIVLWVFLMVTPLLSQIKGQSENLIVQKNKLAESKIKIENIRDFTSNFEQYQANLEKIDDLFVSSSEPIGFIEFLENEATSSQVSIDITVPALNKKDGNAWSFLDFNINLEGSFPNFLRFFERLENAPYLIEPSVLSIRKFQDEDDGISAALSIKVYAK